MKIIALVSFLFCLNANAANPIIQDLLTRANQASQEKNPLPQSLENRQYSCIRYFINKESRENDYDMAFVKQDKYFQMTSGSSFDGVLFVMSPDKAILRGSRAYDWRGFPTKYSWEQFYIAEKDGTLLGILSNNAPTEIYGGGASYIEACSPKN